MVWLFFNKIKLVFTFTKTVLYCIFIFNIFYFFRSPVFAATYYWNQADWAGGEDTTNYPNHSNNQSNWTKYFSKDVGISVGSGVVTLLSTTAVVTHSSSSDFTSGTTNSTSINGSGQIQLSMNSGNVSLDGGGAHTCATTSDGNAFCWGNNASGQLGINSTTQSLVPAQVKGIGGVSTLSDVKQISAGTSHTCAVKNDGTVWCWGLNTEGRLGNGNNTQQLSPVQVKGLGNTGVLTNILKVSAGDTHTCAISNSGYAYCWGSGNWGQLGNNQQSNSTYPVAVSNLTNLVDISTSENFSCAVKSDGIGWCWGLGQWGQIGNGILADANIIPKQVSVVTNFEKIVTGSHYHSCGLTTDKKIYCWGYGEYGNLGSGSFLGAQATPVQVTGITDAEDVSAGYYHSCATRTNGSVVCWGGSDDGQLGDGTNIHRISTFVTVSNISTGSIVTNGAYQSCALKTDGSVVCWGNNGSGRLGNNSTTNTNIPVNTLNNTGDAQLFLTGFASQGTFVSPVINLTKEGGLFYLALGTTKPSGTTIKLEFKTAASEIGLSSASWFGPSGMNTYFTNDSYSPDPTLGLLQYVQYRATLETTNSLATPSLGLVQFKYQSFSDSGFLISSPYDSETNENLISNITWLKSTPTDTSVKFQIRTSAEMSGLVAQDWIGPDGTSSTYFTNNLGTVTPNILKDQSADRWVQYKTILETTNNSFSPILYDASITYVVNAPPQFDSTYQTDGFGITRAATPGILNFLYKVRDIDTDQGSEGNQYKLWPSFQYSIDNGVNWNTITPDQLTGYTTNNPITLSDNSTYFEAATVWDASSVLPDTFTTMKIRVIVDDHEAANNTTAVTSDAFYFDTKQPTINTVEGGGTGININHNQLTSLNTDKTNNSGVTLYFSATDDSNLLVRYSTNSSFTGANYQDYVASVGFTLPVGDGVKTVYAQFKDIYGNESNVYSDTIQLDTTPPSNPSSILSKDISNEENNEYRIFINWPISIDPDWIGYKIYRFDGSVFVLDQTINNVNTNYLVKDSLANQTEYTYKVSNFDDLNNESVGTTVIQVTGSTPSDTTSPIISGISTNNVDENSATISWSTNETATTTVLYSLTNDNFETTKGVDGYSLSHSVTLSGLSPSTNYFYKLRSVDAAGNITETTVSSFTTLSVDNSGPTISTVNNSNITPTGVTISFATNELSSSFIEYSTQSGFTQGNIFGQADLVTSHTVILRSLSPSTTYYYKIRSADSLSNETISTQYSFTTLADPSDVTSPTISGVSVSDITYYSATISFTTDETASSFVEYGLTDSYGSIYGNNTDTTTHTINLPDSLSHQSTYYYRVRVKDAANNETIGVGYTFITASNPADITPPVISNIDVGLPLQNSVTITWETNELSTSYIGFSTDSSYSSEQGSSSLTTNHSVTLIGLSPGTSYLLRIKSADSSGNTTINDNSGSGYNFITQSGHAPPVISSIVTNNVATNSARVKWNTDTSANSFVEYWLNEDSVNWFGNNTLTQSHEVTLPNLLSQSTYHYRVRSKDSSEAESVSASGTFTTLNIGATTTEDSDDLRDEDSILDRIKNGTVEFVKKVIDILPSTSISEDDFIDKMNSMSPKIVSSPSISSNNITVDPGVDSITVTWTTDKKSNSIVAYAPEDQYDSKKDNPYMTLVGNPDEWVTNHSVTIKNLNPNTVYHYEVRSKSEYGNWADSDDFTFTTLSINSEVKDFRFTELGQKSVSANWSTTFESRAMVEVIDIESGKTLTKFEEKGFNRNHEFATDLLQASNNYQLKVITVAKDGTLSKESFFPFSTTTSSGPPIISNVRVSNALISGSIEQVQTIISWKTDKPSTSRILYNEGMSDDLSQSSNLDKSYVVDHIVVTTNFKPGKVYKFKVESTDSSGNKSLSKDFLIMTPKTQESVINLIIDNFMESFSFVTKGKK